jgi:hypothetical protein
MIARASSGASGMFCAVQRVVQVRILRICAEDLDGVPLDRFEPGLVYQVSSAVGSYLIAIGCAVAVLDEEVKSSDEEARQFNVNVRRWREVAAEVSRRGRRRGSL